jgi:GT2 family glycosyltransferase
MVRLSVVIPTFRRPDVLPRTLAALERQTIGPGAFEVVVAEDARGRPDPAVAEAVAAERRPYATRHLIAPAAGASAARNAGWRAARAPLVLFIGDDILADDRMLAEHLRLHERHPEDEVGVLGRVRWARELRVTPFMRWLEGGVQFDFDRIEGEEAGPGRLYTSNASLKAAMLERVGGFDEERFPFHYEDIDLGLRLAEHGFRLLYARRASARHLHQIDFDEYARRMAAVARAERDFVERHGLEGGWFHDRLAEAMRRPPYRGRTGRALVRWVPRRVPWLGPRVWENATWFYRQQLAPQFLAAWDEAEAQARSSTSGRSSAGPK